MNHEKKTTVLLIDDDSAIRDSLKMNLKKFGYTVRLAASGQDGLAELTQDGVDIVLLDQMMPRMDGMAVLRKIREENKYYYLPIIMITANDGVTLAVEFMAGGGTYYLPKPLDPKVLNLKIQETLEKVELRRKLDEAEMSRKTEEERNAAKDALVDMISHELRTPLSWLTPSLETLQEMFPADGHPDAQVHFKLIRNSYDLLMRLADNVADIFLILAGRVEPFLRPIVLASMLDEPRRLIEPEAAAKGLQLTFAFPENLPPVQADENLLCKVLYQLMGNAVKFTERGKVEISARQENGRVILSVKDTGIGIPPEKLKILFHRFSKIDQSGFRPGAGLGLYICRCLLEFMAGEIRVESIPGKGSTFFVSLPVELEINKKKD